MEEKRLKLLSKRAQIENIKADNKNRNVCLVEKSSYDSIIKWMNKLIEKNSIVWNNRPIICGNGIIDGIELGKDYEVVECDIWDDLVEIFGKNIKICRYFVLNPENSKPHVILNPKILSIKCDGDTLKKVVDPKWKVGIIKIKLLDTRRISNYNSYYFISSDNRPISENNTISSLPSTKEKDQDVIHIELRKSDTVPQIPILSSHTSIIQADPIKVLPPKADPINNPPPEICPVGLNNLGNTCYLNAGIQCIIRVQQLNVFLQNDELGSLINKHNTDGSGGEMINEYKNLIYAVSSEKNKGSFSPNSFRLALMKKYKRFANNAQHDAQEVLGSILDCMHEDLKPFDSKSPHSSIISQLFHGQSITCISCPQCKHIETVHESFLFLSLPIPNTLFGSVSIIDCINLFKKPDTLSVSNKWICSGCHKSVQALKSSEINGFPNVFLIHLKRFLHNGVSISKINKNVEYPDILEAKMINESCPDIKYKLFAVVFHNAFLGGGHYTAASVVSNQWYLFDDKYVQKIGQQQVHNDRAYILFYKRI